MSISSAKYSESQNTTPERASARYVFSNSLGIWERALQSAKPVFSDGQAQEEYLRQLFLTTADLSCGSTELQAAIRDWASEYHLSPNRLNLLRPFDFTQSGRVLEVGCGCGAISRYLGEQGVDLLALEASQTRAHITALRCKGLANVEVYCDDFMAFEAEEKFDLITFVGVLEYAPSIPAMLEKAKLHLSKDGKILIAIENRLGLKYFNGRPEDHLDKVYVGLENLYSPTGPSTLGRSEWRSLLNDTGLKDQCYFYPFPDYKLPSLIFSDQAFNLSEFCPAQLLSQLYSRSYSTNNLVNFDEAMVWETLETNKLMQDLANSFLIFASAGSNNDSASKWLAKGYSVHRSARYNCETSFTFENSQLLVSKRPLNANAATTETDGERFKHAYSSETFVPGSVYLNILKRILARGGSYFELVDWTKLWFDFLIGAVQSDKPVDLSADLSEALLPPNFMDCCPHNLILDRSGNLHYFDREWHAEGGVPLAWLLVRGLCISLQQCTNKGFLRHARLSDVIFKILGQLGVKLTRDDLERVFAFDEEFCAFANSEKSVWRNYTLRSRINNELENSQTFTLEYLAELNSKLSTLQNQLFDLKLSEVKLAEELSTATKIIDDILRSKSWRFSQRIQNQVAKLRRLKTQFSVRSALKFKL